jgi:hypothetical protein
MADLTNRRAFLMALILACGVSTSMVAFDASVSSAFAKDSEGEGEGEGDDGDDGDDGKDGQDGKDGHEGHGGKGGHEAAAADPDGGPMCLDPTRIFNGRCDK